MVAQPESMLNKDLKMPMDVVLLFVWTFYWAIAHASFKAWIKPIAARIVIGDPLSTPTTTTSIPAAPKGNKNSTLRQRKKGGKAEKEPVATSPVVQKAPKNAPKFVISAWRFTNYVISVVVGVYVLSKEPWTFSPPDYYVGWPEQHTMSPLVKMYYQMSFGSCFYMFFSLFTEKRQKDFVAMIVHHVVTVSIIAASYFVGLFRVGAVILVLHDLVDPFLEVAKMFVYTGWQRFADLFFVIFAVIFLFTRSFVFPVYVVPAVNYYGYHEDGTPVPYGRLDIRYFCMGGLWILCCLHFYWSYLIIKMVFKAIIDKKVEGDIRDEDEDD
ncbi:Ceramide synthase 2 [Phlyctochytrium planicorne]|nr:Ceramide synthase 2 [Phlyctochytrium planicorne]